eukprot:1181367-Pyramimonas_sp.AAC.1
MSTSPSLSCTSAFTSVVASCTGALAGAGVPHADAPLACGGGLDDVLRGTARLAMIPDLKVHT